MYDLGCGIGKIVTQFAFETNCKKCVGIELGTTRYEKSMVALDRMKEAKLKAADKIDFILGNILDGYYYKDLKNFNLNSNQLVKILEEYISILKELYKNNTDPYFKSVLKLISDIYIYFKIDIFKKFDYKIFEKMLLNKKTLSKNYKEFLYKLDVYMLGLTLYELLINIFIHLRKNPSINKIPLEIFSLIKKMVLFNPYERLTIQQATIEFKSIMKI
jgi:SAM-dependent methyltransferase